MTKNRPKNHFFQIFFSWGYEGIFGKAFQGVSGVKIGFGMIFILAIGQS